MSLPKDPAVLFSYINTLLRDKYGSLRELCGDMQLSEEDIIKNLEAAGFYYDETRNRFR